LRQRSMLRKKNRFLYSLQALMPAKQNELSTDYTDFTD
jgi:hypothetical protein